MRRSRRRSIFRRNTILKPRRTSSCSIASLPRTRLRMSRQFGLSRRRGRHSRCAPPPPRRNWIAGTRIRRSDVQAGTVGTVNVTLDKGVNPASVKVLGDDQRPLPFTIEGNRLQFFAGAAGNVRVITGDRETVYSLTLPDVGDVAWRPPADV